MKPLGKETKEFSVMVWIGSVAGLVLLMWGSSALSAGSPPAGEGESTYKAKCVMCHAADGSGDTPMGKKLKLKDLRSPVVQKQSDAKLAEIIAKGKSPMPAYEKQLDKKKTDEVVAYLRELAKKH